MPALERGWEKAGKARADFQVSGPLFVVTGTNDEEIAKARAGTKQQIAFYGSTPAYRGVLELHGWGDLQTELNGCRSRASGSRWASSSTTRSSRRSRSSASPKRSRRCSLGRYGDIVDRCRSTRRTNRTPTAGPQVLDGLQERVAPASGTPVEPEGEELADAAGRLGDHRHRRLAFGEADVPAPGFDRGRDRRGDVVGSSSGERPARSRRRTDAAVGA